MAEVLIAVWMALSVLVAVFLIASGIFALCNNDDLFDGPINQECTRGQNVVYGVLELVVAAVLVASVGYVVELEIQERGTHGPAERPTSADR